MIFDDADEKLILGIVDKKWKDCDSDISLIKTDFPYLNPFVLYNLWLVLVSGYANLAVT